MKKFVSLLTSMIVTLFLIGCSNPSSSSGGSLSLGGAEDKTITLSLYSYDTEAKFVNIWNHAGLEFDDSVSLSTSWEWAYSQGIMTANSEHEKWYDIKLKIKSSSVTDGFDIYKSDSTNGADSDKLFSCDSQYTNTDIYQTIINGENNSTYFIYWDDSSNAYKATTSYPWNE